MNETCNSRGRCGAFGECECEAGVSGAACLECSDGQFGAACEVSCHWNSTCGGHGWCSSEGTCICEAGYFGPGSSSTCMSMYTCDYGIFQTIWILVIVSLLSQVVTAVNLDRMVLNVTINATGSQRVVDMGVAFLLGAKLGVSVSQAGVALVAR